MWDPTVHSKESLMTEGRGQRAIPKVNYLLLHMGESEDETGEQENLEVSELRDRRKPSIVLVEETPLTSPVQDIEEQDLEPGNSPSDITNVVPESQVRTNLDLDTNMADNLLNELNEAEIEERKSKVEEARVETEHKARLLAEQIEVEAKERQVVLMKKQIEELTDVWKKAQESPAVLNWAAIGDDDLAKQLANVLKILKSEEEEHKKKQLAIEEANRIEEEERLRREEELRKQAEEEERLRKEAEQKTDETGDHTDENSKLSSILEWVKEQHDMQKQQQAANAKLKELQDQTEAMTKSDNRLPCQATGVNFFANLEALQGESSGARVDLAAKAHAAMQVANNAKRKAEWDQDSDGESDNSTTSHGKGKKSKMVSGLAQKLGQKVRYEVEWAHHWLGKEFDANPVAFNQLKIGQFMMGEADIILNCSKPEEIRARLRLMHRLGYWQTRYEWTSVRNVYAAIMCGIETGREDWQFDSRDYEDMLVLNTNKTAQNSRDDRPKCPRDFFYCGPFQRGECQLDSPHMAKVV